jgi:hypothetical protein
MPWSIGIMECWNTEKHAFGGKRSVFLYWWRRVENKNRLSSAFDSQYSIFPSFHFPLGYLMAKTILLG